MKLETYQKAAQRTLPSLGDKYFKAFIEHNNLDKELLKELGLKLDLAHMALGVASELSELEECLTASKLDYINLDEELGDKMWYGVNWANLLNITLDFDRIINLWDSKSFDGNREIIIYGGQLADIAKRFLAYGSSLEAQEEKRKKSDNYLSNEDILYNYLAALYEQADIFDRNIEIIMGKNITKLYVRYPEQFSEDMALMRDLEAERLALEGK